MARSGLGGIEFYAQHATSLQILTSNENTIAGLVKCHQLKLLG
jgi:hypothetical protein